MNETDQKELDALRAFFDVSEKHMPSGAINDAPEDFQAAHAAVLATRHPGVGYSKDLRAGLQPVPDAVPAPSAFAAHADELETPPVTTPETSGAVMTPEPTQQGSDPGDAL